MAKKILRRIRIFVTLISAIIFVLLMFTKGILDNMYVQYSRISNPKEMEIYPYKVKNIVVYLSQFDFQMIELINSALLWSVTVLLLSVISDKIWPLKSKFLGALGPR